MIYHSITGKRKHSILIIQCHVYSDSNYLIYHDNIKIG